MNTELSQVIHYRARVCSSALQFLYWLLHVLCYVPTFKQVTLIH